jgi:GH24 family phage-related lysozyme (muramidase)
MANLIPYTKSPIIKSQKSAIIKADKFLNAKTKSTKVNVNSVKPKQSKDPSEDIILQIEKKVIKIDKLLKDSFALKKKQQKKVRIKEEQKEFEDREKELEKKKPKKEKGVNLPTPPKMGFIDWIKNFVFNTILGFLAVRLMKFLPTLLKIYPVIIGAGEFLINVGGNLLNSLVSFVDWGYKAVDSTSGFIKSIGGEGLSKVFDNFMGAIDNVLEFAVMAAIVSSGGNDDSDSGGLGVKGGRKGFDSQGRRVGKNVQQRYARRFGKDQFVDRFDTKNVKNVAQGAGRRGLQQGARNAFVGVAGKGGAKSILKFVRPLTNKLPIIGGLLNFGLSVALGEDPGRSAFKAIGSTLVGALGAAIGSLAFGVGGIIGGIIGGIGGDALGGALYDMFFKGKKPTQKQGKTNKLAGGGSPIPPTRGGKSVSSTPKRTLKKKKSTRTLTFTPRKIQPGRSAGGEAKVQSVFPNPEKAWWDPLGVFTGKKQEQQPQQKKPKGKTANPQEFLIKSNDIFGRAKGTAGKMISGFATYIIKSLLGDVPDDLDYLNLSKGLNSFMQGIFEPGTLAFSGGGEVDARQFFDGKDYTKVIAKSVKESGSKEVDTIVRNLRNEMSLRPVGKEEMTQDNIQRGTEGDGGGGGGGGGIIMGTSFDSSLAKLLKSYEGLRTAAYKDAVGIPTIGMGATYYPKGFRLSGSVKMGQTITEDEALMIKMKHIAEHRNRLLRDISATEYAKVPDNVKAALESKTFNYGNLGSTLAGLVKDGIKTGNYQSVADYFRNTLAKHDGGLNSWRRNDEAGIIEKGISQRSKVSFPRSSGGQAVAEYKEKGGKATEGSETLGKGYGSGGSKIAGELGRFIKKNLRQGPDFSQVHRHPEHPPYSLSSGHSRGSLHYQGRAVDIGAHHFEQGPILKVIEQYNKKYNVKPVQLLHAGNDPKGGHNDHVHVAYAKGGKTLDGPHRALIGEEGTEYVIDNKSFETTEKFLPGLLDILNYKVNDKASLIKYLPNIISSLSQYTYYGNPNQEPQYIVIKSPPEIRYVSTGSGGKNVFIGGGVNNNMVSFDIEQKLSCMA